MKKVLLISWLILTAISCPAQDRDSLLSQINRIKKDSEHYLYEVCNEENLEVSREEARKALLGRVAAYLSESHFLFLIDGEDVPSDSISFISIQPYPSCFRSIAFIRKESLDSLDGRMKRAMEDLNRREKYEAFVNELAGIKSVTALKALMRNDEFKEQIMSGLRFEKLSDTQLKQVFLVYYDQRDDTVFEIMSPQDADGMRWNITTGQLAEPLAYRIAPLWLRYNY